jgi:hypothetical protein
LQLGDFINFCFPTVGRQYRGTFTEWYIGLSSNRNLQKKVTNFVAQPKIKENNHE